MNLRSEDAGARLMNGSKYGPPLQCESMQCFKQRHSRRTIQTTTYKFRIMKLSKNNKRPLDLMDQNIYTHMDTNKHNGHIHTHKDYRCYLVGSSRSRTLGFVNNSLPMLHLFFSPPLINIIAVSAQVPSLKRLITCST